jgi:predicted RNA-binding Zn-ribbon protein involved in translation (DUF1610 family)
MNRKAAVICIMIVFLLAGGVGFLLLRGGEDTSGVGSVAERAVEEGMADDRVKVEGELFSCPKCGGEGGFHVGFRQGIGKREGTLEVILVCPHCGYRFAAGDFHIPSGEQRPFDPSIDSGP